jgi:murein DD-endopeptidase MepM/ murein hydrolase activator NlpD
MRHGCLGLVLLWALTVKAEVLYRLPWPDGLAFTFTQVADGRITTHFTKATRHAVDIAMPVGVAVLAARGGVVEGLEAGQGATPEEEPSSYEGNFVRVRHDDGTIAIYAHLAPHSAAVALGEAVRAGQLLARSGASGDVSEPQLHFAVIRAQKNGAGYTEEVSLPLRFYVGSPPVGFPPRAAVRVAAQYSHPTQPPRAPSEWQPLVPWKPAALDPWQTVGAWCLLAAWLAGGVAGMLWFWSFSRR